MRKDFSYIQLPRRNRGGREYTLVVASARALVHNRLAYFNQLYGCKIGRISIRKQRARWASATKSSGNLSFNYRIAYLPLELADYLVVHELCHLIEANHSSRFWAQVARVLPHHKMLRAQLRRYRF